MPASISLYMARQIPTVDEAAARKELYVSNGFST